MYMSVWHKKKLSLSPFPVMRLLFYILFLCLITANVFAAEDMLSGMTPSSTSILQNSACVQCHEQQNSTLIRNWQASAHATASPIVNCVSCHGQLHQGIAAKARRDETCVVCHGGKKAPVVHSYSSSKHGTLMQIEKNTYDWNRPLRSANYRAPGCAYCHLQQNNHNVSMSIRKNLMSDEGVAVVQDNIRAVCQNCHAPRYISRLFENGEAMLEIARKKVREADALIKQAEKVLTDEELFAAKKQYEKMLSHVENVYLGAGHQSPDYQWWHGQPALDGDLLRIKDSISEYYRLKP